MWIGPLCTIIALFILFFGILIHIIFSKSERFKVAGTIIGKVIIAVGLIFTVFMFYTLFTYESTSFEGFEVFQDKRDSSNDTTSLLFENDYGEFGTLVNIYRQDGQYSNITIHGIGPSNMTTVTVYLEDYQLNMVEISPEPVSSEFNELEDNMRKYYTYKLTLRTSSETVEILFMPCFSIA